MPGIELEVKQEIDRDMIEIVGPREIGLSFAASKNAWLESETPAGRAELP